MFSLQSSPVQPLTQTQVWPPIVLKQVPPLWQALGCMRHSLTSSAQYCPGIGYVIQDINLCTLRLIQTACGFRTHVVQDHTCPLRRTLTVVGVDSIDTFSSIHTLMARTVIHIIFTVVTLKPWNRWSRWIVMLNRNGFTQCQCLLNISATLLTHSAFLPLNYSYISHTIGGVGGNASSKKFQWVSDCLHLLMMVSIRCPQQPWPQPPSEVHTPCSVCLFNNLSQFQWLPLWQETFPASSPVGKQKVHKVNSSCFEQSWVE